MQVLRDAGIDVSHLTLRRAEGGRAQLYDVDEPSGRELVREGLRPRQPRRRSAVPRLSHARCYRGPNEQFISGSLDRDVEHEALLLLVARRAGVRCPALEVMTALPDGSLVLALEEVDRTGHGSTLDVDEIDDALLDATWRQADTLHRSRIAHRALHAVEHPRARRRARSSWTSASRRVRRSAARSQSIGPSSLASLAADVGADAGDRSAMRVLEPDDLAAAMPYLQPLALSAVDAEAQPSKSLLAGAARRHRRSHRTEAGAGRAARPRSRPATLVTIAALTGAFYVLLPQLANVGDSFTALRTANFGWLARRASSCLG